MTKWQDEWEDANNGEPSNEESHHEAAAPEPLCHDGSVITSIERQPRQPRRYIVSIDGRPVLTVHEDVLIKHRLLKGSEVDPDKLSQVIADEEQQKAWSDALKQVGRRPRSELEVRQYLKRRGYDARLAEQVVKRLLEQGYINDTDFAAQWTEQRMLSQKKGRRLVKMELQQKGVAPARIEEAMEHISHDQEREAAYALACKKWKLVSGETIDKKRKTMAYLVRRGYAPSLVGSILREVAVQMQEEADALSSDNDDFFIEME